MKICIVFIACIFVFVLILLLFTETVRPLEIIIVDEESNEALENIVVQYQIMTAGPGRMWGVIPRLDPVDYQFTKVFSYKTDKDGVVTIPRKFYMVELYQTQFQEVVLVNLDILESKKNKNPEFSYLTTRELINLNPEYIGVKIYNLTDLSEQSAPIKMISNERVAYNLIQNKGSLDKESESMLLKLSKRTQLLR